MGSSKDECAICLERLTAREGQALFTAECSHTFHFSCIASNVQHGNHICPTCRCKWTHLPSQFIPASTNIPEPPPFNINRPVQNYHPFQFIPASTNIPQPPPFNINRPVRNYHPVSPASTYFNDDEPLPIPEANSAPPPPRPSQQNGEMTVKALPEFPAVSRSERSDSFSVLFGIRAPPLSAEASDRPDARAPVDLVAVLDISGSMDGDKIRLLKQAMGFVADNLGPTDRLSVIVFSTSARRVTPLRRMTDVGRTETIQAVNSLQANGSTNIIAGLKMAVQVLEQRSHKNPVASIILLSDGRDNANGYGSQFLQSLGNLPPCIRANAQSSTPANVLPVPVHTFGFGSDHDATALHAIADGSGGTFSYIESIEILQDAFAQCIGGLLSVVAQEVEIHVHSGSGSVQILSISSGRYRNTINNDPNQHGIVYVGDVYAEEEKQFLVNLTVPEASASSPEETDTLTTKLLEVKCSYKDPIRNESIMSETVIVEIRRPLTENLSEADRQVCLEVDREKNRNSIAEGIAEAQVMADRGELEGARMLLGQRRMRLMCTPSAQAGDGTSSMLEAEVLEIESRMTNRADYEGSGKAYAFSMRNSHNFQRASTRAMSSTKKAFFSVNTSSSAVFAPGAPSNDGSAYQTSAMRKMVNKSMELRNSGGSSNSN